MKKSYFLLFAMALVLSACKPDIESCFTATPAGPGAVLFSSDCSVDAVDYTWQFGDGTTSITANPIHTYATGGAFSVALRVTDKKGRSSTTTQTVTVAAPCPTCVNGSCVAGACVCSAGYEGTTCSTGFNAKFSGVYSLTETCTSGPDFYSATLTPSSSNVFNVSFSGLYREATPIAAVIGSDGLSFTIALQPIFTGYEIACTNGTSNAAGTTINLTYSIYQTGSSSAIDVCTVTLAR